MSLWNDLLDQFNPNLPNDSSDPVINQEVPTNYSAWIDFIDKTVNQFGVSKSKATTAAAILESQGYQGSILPDSVNDVLKGIFDDLAKDSENLRTVDVAVDTKFLVTIGIVVLIAVVLSKKL